MTQAELYDVVDYVFENVLPKTTEPKRDEFVDLLMTSLVQEGFVAAQDEDEIEF